MFGIVQVFYLEITITQQLCDTRFLVQFLNMEKRIVTTLEKQECIAYIVMVRMQ